MGLWLKIEAAESASGAFAIEAMGRDAGLCGRVENNLILETYRDVLAGAGRAVVGLDLRIENEIPLGMGCGSSAAALLGGVTLANHFGGLGWDRHACMEEAFRREGHPDNVAACALGFFTVSAAVARGVAGAGASSVVAATCGQGLGWKLLLALPTGSLATVKARALLPAEYSRADAVANVQRTALLVAAFALGRGELLRVAMEDRMHQPYRMAACPLLARLLPLAGEGGVLGVALSGAGPGVLLVVEAGAPAGEIIARIREAAGEPSLEVIETEIAGGAIEE
jgi:homoserine kinase